MQIRPLNQLRKGGNRGRLNRHEITQNRHEITLNF